MINNEYKTNHHTLFKSIRREYENENEYWSARDLARTLEYADYRNFIKVIEKAKEACQDSSHQVSDHFVDVNEMIRQELLCKQGAE